MQIGEQFCKNQSVKALAKSAGIQEKTVINHLFTYISEGNAIPEGDLPSLTALSSEIVAQVLEEFGEHGTDFLKPVYQAMDESVSWDDLRVLRICFLLENMKK